MLKDGGKRTIVARERVVRTPRRGGGGLIQYRALCGLVDQGGQHKGYERHDKYLSLSTCVLQASKYGPGLVVKYHSGGRAGRT